MGDRQTMNGTKSKPRKRGPKPKPAGERLASFLTVPLKPEQRAWIEGQADGEDITLAEFARRELLRKYPGPK